MALLLIKGSIYLRFVFERSKMLILYFRAIFRNKTSEGWLFSAMRYILGFKIRGRKFSSEISGALQSNWKSFTLGNFSYTSSKLFT